MASATQKITSLGDWRDIPFNKLVLSESNVRRIKRGISIPELAEDIARRGLLKNLNVRPVIGADGSETGMFEVPAGGRRFRALELLVKEKRLARTTPIRCNVRAADSTIPAEEDSLAENVQMVALHPLDQFRAFKDLVDLGVAEADVAARFFVTPAVVRQRLRLASVEPSLLVLYAEDAMSLEQLMAFTVSADHARQLQVWEAISRSHYRAASEIRRLMTEGALRMSDRRVQFVGIDAYQEAGGLVLSDLFSTDDNAWLQDVGLVELLASERLREEAATVAAEGWKWVEASVDFPYGHTAGLRRLSGVGVRLTEEEQAARAAFVEELDAIYTEYDANEDLPEAVDQRFAELETAIEEFDNRPILYDAAEVARAGVFLSVDGNGNLRIDRGYVRPEDEQPEGGETADCEAPNGESSAPQRAIITIGGEAEGDQSDEVDGILKPLSERLLGELTAHRTLALRNAVAGNPDVALTALLHKLVRDTFNRGSTTGGSIEASVRHVFLPMQGAELSGSLSAKAVADRQAAWAECIPSDDKGLWDWLVTLSGEDRSRLLAHCVSFGVNALIEKVDRFGGAGLSQHGLSQRLLQADRLARAVGLDMHAAGWRPTVETYLGKVTKPRILEAVREAKGEQAEQLIDHLKKADMAREAERLLADTGWLPEALRTVSEEAGDEPVALPDFLDGDEDDSPADGEDPGSLAIAAE